MFIIYRNNDPLKGESISFPIPLQSSIKQAIPPTIFVCIDAKRPENGYYRERQTFGSDFNDLCTAPQVILRDLGEFSWTFAFLANLRPCRCVGEHI